MVAKRTTQDRASDEEWGPTPRPSERQDGARKTAKLYINGAFVRSESGRTYPGESPEGVVELPGASRKDARDAVRAARKAASGWSARTGYNQGQILYRMAEMLDGRNRTFRDLLSSVVGDNAEIDWAVERLIWWAGVPDKLDQITGSVNPVAGPFHNLTRSAPAGVVGSFVPGELPLLSLVEAIAAPLAGGSVVVAVLEPTTAVIGLEFAEVLATADVPAGVVSLLTGQRSEVGLTLATHQDVDLLDLSGATNAMELEALAAGTLKRSCSVRDVLCTPDAARIAAFVEPQTIWHPIGR